MEIDSLSNKIFVSMTIKHRVERFLLVETKLGDLTNFDFGSVTKILPAESRKLRDRNSTSIFILFEIDGQENIQY